MIFSHPFQNDLFNYQLYFTFCFLFKNKIYKEINNIIIYYNKTLFKEKRIFKFFENINKLYYIV